MNKSDVESVISNIIKILDSQGLAESGHVLTHIKNRMSVVIDGELDFSSVDNLVYDGHLVAILGGLK